MPHAELRELAEERLALAGLIGEAARRPARPTVAFWEPLWRIDALLELGRLPDTVATLPLLRQRIDAAGSPWPAGTRLGSRPPWPRQPAASPTG